MDITSLFAVGSKDIAKAYNQTAIAKEHAEDYNKGNFESLLNTAIKNKRCFYCPVFVAILKLSKVYQ